MKLLYFFDNIDLNLVFYLLKKDLEQIFDRLWPICRSITGEGIKVSLNIIKEYIPLEIFSKLSGDKVFDWTIPKEWIIKEGYLKGPDGKKYCDFKKSNLSIINYSSPIDSYLELNDFKDHIYTIKNLPNAIPYVTSYYQSNWGFCIKNKDYVKLPKKGKYHCFIDSSFINGSLNYGQFLLDGGLNKKEILLSSYLCHPSMANNELSGPLVLIGLFKKIQKWKSRRFNYRFYIGPETIGSLCFLSDFGDLLKRQNIMGLVLTCLGGKNEDLSVKLPRDTNSFGYKYLSSIRDFRKRVFTPDGGSDERQFCSPGFNLPIANICRDVYGEYKEYHNSLDNKEFMGIDSLILSINRLENLLLDFELEYPFERYEPRGEPQLGKRNLYPNINSQQTWEASADNIFDGKDLRKSIMWILSYADGSHSLQDIHSLSGCNMRSLKYASNLLLKNRLIY